MEGLEVNGGQVISSTWKRGFLPEGTYLLFLQKNATSTLLLLEHILGGRTPDFSLSKRGEVLLSLREGGVEIRNYVEKILILASDA